MLKPRAAWLVGCGALIAALGHWHARPHAARLSQAEVATTDTLRPVLDRYCITCHNQTLKTAGLVLDGFDMTSVGRDADTWERVARKLRTREMPPPGLPRPDRDDLRTRDVDARSRARRRGRRQSRSGPRRRPSPEPHRVRQRDSRSAGARRRRAIAAARRRARSARLRQRGGRAVGLAAAARELPVGGAARSAGSRSATDRSAPVEDTFKIPTALVQDDRIERRPAVRIARRHLRFRYHFPLDGEYRIKVLLRRQLYLYLIGMGEPHQIDIRLDGALLKRFTIGGEGKGHDGARELRRQHAGRSGVGSLHAHRRRRA